MRRLCSEVEGLLRSPAVHRRQSLAPFAALLALACVAPCAFAQIRCAKRPEQGGSDSNSGTTWSTAWATIDGTIDESEFLRFYHLVEVANGTTLTTN